MVIWWHALWCVWFIDCYCFPVFLCEAEMYLYEILDLTIFASSISYIWIYFLVALMGLKCLFWSWWCHVVTCLTWPFWSLRSILFWDTSWLFIENRWTLWFILVAHWEPLDIVIYHWWSLIAYRELLWLLWLSFDAFKLLMEN